MLTNCSLQSWFCIYKSYCLTQNYCIFTQHKAYSCRYPTYKNGERLQNKKQQAEYLQKNLDKVIGYTSSVSSIAESEVQTDVNKFQ